MISSARSSSVCGIVRPSALAVLRLTTSSNLVGFPRLGGEVDRSRHGTRLSLRRQAHTPRSDQPRIGGLEAPEGPADSTHQIDVLIIGTAEGEIGCCRIVVWYRHKTDNNAARVDLNDATETE